MRAEECRHELPIGQCDFCKPKPPAAPKPRRLGPSRVFEARFGSRCSDCQERIHEGDLVRYNDDDEVVHEGCG